MSTRLRPLRMRHVVWGGVLGGAASGVVVSLLVADDPLGGDALMLSYFSFWFLVAGTLVGVVAALASWGAGCLVTIGRPESRGRAVVTVTVASVLGGASIACLLRAFDFWSYHPGEAVAGVVVGVVGGAAGAFWAVWMSQGKPATTPSTRTTGDGAAPAA